MMKIKFLKKGFHATCNTFTKKILQTLIRIPCIEKLRYLTFVQVSSFTKSKSLLGGVQSYQVYTIRRFLELGFNIIGELVNLSRRNDYQPAELCLYHKLCRADHTKVINPSDV